MRAVRPLAALIALVAAMPVGAHRGHDALSVVTLAASGAVTVSHRFEAHDIEPALAKIAPAAQVSLDDPQAVAALERYIAARFVLAFDGVPVKLRHVGTDLKTAEVRVEFAGTAPAKAAQASVRSSILTDVYPRQVNQVNLRARGRTRSVTLSGGRTRTIALQ